MRQRRAPHSFFFFHLFKAASHSALFCLAVHENYIIKDIWHIRGYIHCSELIIYIYKKTKKKQEELLLEEQKQKQVGPDAQTERNRLRYFVKATLMRWRVFFVFFPL